MGMACYMNTEIGQRLPSNIVQVAGIHDAEEAQLIKACGVNYLGFPLQLAMHTEDISVELAASVIAELRPPTYGVLITYLTTAEAILELSDRLGTSIVQIHGDIDSREIIKLRETRPSLVVIKSLIVGLLDLSKTERIIAKLSPFVDAFLTDTYDPVSGATGATGKTHDWSMSKRIVELSVRPVILAGGLTPENVRQAILKVQPAGVDSHTGVEDEFGRKDKKKIEKFVSEALLAFDEIAPS